MLPKPQVDRWNAFYSSAYRNKVLDRKTTVLLHLASAMAAGCQP